MPFEVKIWEEVRNTIPNLKRVALTKGSCNWLHCVLSLKKQREGDGKNAIIAALAARPSLKLAIAVDDDINADDPSDVEYAIATRFQGDKGLIVIPNAKGSSLNPSADQISLITMKMGIDAATCLSKPKGSFERIRIPGEEMIRLEDYLEKKRPSQS